MSTPTALLHDSLAAIEAKLYARRTPIVITSWDPPHVKDSFVVTYVREKKSMQGIPSTEVSLSHIADESDFFFLRQPQADKYLPERAQEESITVGLAAWEQAVECSWRKVQCNQEYGMPAHIEPVALLFHSQDIARCSSGLSPFSPSQIEQYQAHGEYHLWNTQRQVYLARRGQVNLARWQCKRHAEALTIAAVARGCPTEQERFTFLRRLKQLADQKIGIH